MPAYRVIEKLGEGGMGVVYRAVQTSLEREVALKLLLDASSENPGFVARFHREVEASARIVHPNVVKILDYGEIQGKPFYAMEYLVQPTLKDLLENLGRFTVPRAVSIFQQLLDALCAIHRAGMVHRDLKPSNVMIGERDHVTVMDFGLVKFAPDRSVLTKTGMIVGTPSYLSPEVIRGQPVDGRADLFTAGAIVHEILTGARTFTASSLPALLNVIVTMPHRPVREVRPDCPAALSEVIDRLLAKDPADRYATAADALEAVERFAEARLARAALDATAPEVMPVRRPGAGEPGSVSQSTIDGGLAVLENVPAAPHGPRPAAPARRTGRTAIAARVTATTPVVPPPASGRRGWMAGAALSAVAVACAALAPRPSPAPPAGPGSPAASLASPPASAPPAPAPGPALVRAIQELDPARRIDAIHEDLRRIRPEYWHADPPRPEMRSLRDSWRRQLSERAARAGLPAALAAFAAARGAAPSPASRRDGLAALHRLLDLRRYCDRFGIPLALDPELALRGSGPVARSRLTDPAGLCLRFKRMESNTGRIPPRMTPGLTLIDVERSEVFSAAGYTSDDVMDATFDGARDRLDYVHPGALPLPAPSELAGLEIGCALEGLDANNRLTVLASSDGRSFAPVAFFRSEKFHEGELFHAVDSALLGPKVHLKLQVTVLPSMRTAGEYVNVMKLELRYRRKPD